MDTTGCPEAGCSFPAEILDRAIIESTDGPIEHARIVCIGGHRFLMPTELLPQRDDLWAALAQAVTVAVNTGERWSR